MKKSNFYSRRRSVSGHLEIILAVIIAIMGGVWYFQSRSAKTRTQPPIPAYYHSNYTQQIPVSNDFSYTDKINHHLVFVSAGLIYALGIMTGLFFPLLHSFKQKHRTVPFSFSHVLPTKANRVMGSLDSLQKMRDMDLISNGEYEAKRLELLRKM